jgi:hypothetical protein
MVLSSAATAVYRWLHASGGATVKASGGWTLARVLRPGRYTLTS